MTINLSVPENECPLKPKIMVIGVGGAGSNAVNNMIVAELEGVDFLVANTDAQSLVQSRAERKIQLGLNITHGLGAGSRPDIGRAAAEETIDEIAKHLAGANMVFITAGMGGGTGTGAAPVIARLAGEQGVLVVGVVTKPFQFEGSKRAGVAEAGIEELQKHVDTLIVIPNQNLFRVANENTTFAEAFAKADEVLHSGVRGVTDLMMVPGLINLDFADIRTVMSEMGKAMMGTGEAEGEERATAAAESAISNPLLDDVSMKGARGVLINITGGPDMTLFEVDQVANRIGEEVDPDAHIISGATLDPELQGRIRVSVVATGIETEVEARSQQVLQVAQNPKPSVPAAFEYTPASGVRAEAMPSSVQPASPPPVQPSAAAADRAPLSPSRPVLDAAPTEDEPEAAAPFEIMAQDSFFSDEADEGDTAEDVPEPMPSVEEDEVDFIEPEALPDKPPRRPNLLQRLGLAGGQSRDRREVEPLPPAFSDADMPETLADEPPEPEEMPTENVSPPRQRKFDSVASEDASPAAEEDEDILEIPAFLRRQAN